ncbi:MAG: RNA polymerase sporulation sigma factor SigH [Armatimonadota bacterium]
MDVGRDGGSSSLAKGYTECTDEELVLSAREGNKAAEEYLLRKYRSLVEGKARSYFLVGADHEDVVQEGMIGLFKAIRDFRDDRASRFKAFAELCVTRQIITAIKTATRQKHVPLNSYVSLNRPVFDEDPEGMLMDVIPDTQAIDPESVVMNREVTEYLESQAQKDLSPLEYRVLQSYLERKSYKEMADELNCQTKSIDNALQRAKRKIGDRLGRG